MAADTAKRSRLRRFESSNSSEYHLSSTPCMHVSVIMPAALHAGLCSSCWARYSRSRRIPSRKWNFYWSHEKETAKEKVGERGEALRVCQLACALHKKLGSTGIRLSPFSLKNGTRTLQAGWFVLIVACHSRTNPQSKGMW